MIDGDQISGLLRLMTKAFGAGFPIRLAFGAGLGTLAKILIHMMARIYSDVTSWNALNEFSAIWFIIVFIPLTFVPIILGRRGAPEQVIHQISTVEALIDQSGFTSAQRALVWRSLIEKYLAAIQPQFTPPPSLPELFGETKSEISSKSSP